MTERRATMAATPTAIQTKKNRRRRHDARVSLAAIRRTNLIADWGRRIVDWELRIADWLRIANWLQFAGWWRIVDWSSRIVVQDYAPQSLPQSAIRNPQCAMEQCSRPSCHHEGTFVH